MKTALAAAFLGVFTLSACAPGFTDNISRVSTMLPILPKAADREGIYNLRDIRGSILVQYFPGQVRESQIMARLTTYCARKGGVPRRSGNNIGSQAELPDGRIVSTRSIVVQCR